MTSFGHFQVEDTPVASTVKFFLVICLMKVLLLVVLSAIKRRIPHMTSFINFRVEDSDSVNLVPFAIFSFPEKTTPLLSAAVVKPIRKGRGEPERIQWSRGLESLAAELLL